jgi:hypothetical protein
VCSGRPEPKPAELPIELLLERLPTDRGKDRLEAGDFFG